MTLGGKVIAGVATLGTLGGGSLLVNNLLNKPITYEAGTVGATLISEGFKLEVGNQWQTILNAHNAIQDTTNTFKDVANTNLKLNELQAKCQSVLKEKNNTNYKKARKWCVKPEKISVILKNGNYDLLDTTATNDTSDTLWANLATRLNESKERFPNVGSQMTNNSVADVKTLKSGCAGLQIDTVTTISEGFDSKFENTRDWCAVKKTSNQK